MTSDVPIFSTAFAGFSIFFIIFSILNRKREAYPIHNILLSFGLGLIVSGVLLWPITSLTLTLLEFFLYILLVAVYIFAVYLNIVSSVHARIFQEVAQRDRQGLTYKELITTYSKQIVLKKRLAWLLTSGEIGKDGNTFYLRRRHSLLLWREKFLYFLGKLYGSGEEFNILLLFILLGAVVVRVWGIDFGLPDKHYGDEQHLIYWAFYSGSHTLRPPYYLYAPLIPMILLVEFSLYYIGGFLFGLFSTPLHFFTNYLSDPSPFFLIGRLTMAFTGVATVWLLYVLGKTFFNTRTGFFASFFLAFTFLHVKESHYIKQDIMMGFFVLAAFYFALTIAQKGRLRDYIWCGITFALAFGAKYQAIIIFPLILFVNIVSTRTIISKKLVSLGITFFFIFSLIHPYLIIEPKATIEQTLPFAVSIVSLVYPEHLLGKPVWWWFMFKHIPQGIGYPVFITALAGFALCIFRARAKKQYLFIPLLPLVFFVTVDILTSLHFARYAVIILPFLMLAAAIFSDFLLGVIPKYSRALSLSLAIVLVFPSVLRIVKFNTLLTQSDTRTLAKTWFEKVVPVGSKVLVESTVKPEYPSSFNLSLALDGESIDNRIHEAETIGQEALYLRALKQANQDKIGYEIIATTQVGAITDVYTDQLTRIKNVRPYVENGVSYIVLTSWVQEKMSQEFEGSLQAQYQLIKEFRPVYVFQTDPHLIRMDYETLDKIDPMRRDLVFGPIISVYKAKSY